MKKNSIIKIIIDILMIVLMLLEYSKLYTGQLLHEVFGIILFMLFVAHNILNINFYKNLFKGNYNFTRIMMTITNLAFLFCMLVTIILGIPISHQVFSFLKLKGNMTTIKLHTILGYWGIIILAIHLGLHFKMIFTKVINKMKTNRILKIVIYFLEILIILYGIKIMIDTNFFKYLIGEYSFGNFNGNVIVSFINNLSIVLSISIMIYNIQKICNKLFSK